MIAEQLKKSILQAAIQGKLTKHLPEDGDAKDLLNDIRKTKAQLIKDGKVKREKIIPKILDDEIPFDIPDNWCWARLGEISVFINGDRSAAYPKSSDYVGDGIPFFGATDMIDGRLLFTDVRFITEEKFNSLRSGKLKNLDLICLLRGSIGKTAKFEESQKYTTGFINAQMVIIRIINQFVVDYLELVLNSKYFDRYISEVHTGTAVKQLAAETLRQIIIPLPPLKEQNRIVSAVRGIFTNQLYYLNQDEVKLDALENTFPKKMRESILQAAIKGNLTEQLASDGDARDLVKEIKKEKERLVKEGRIKKEKPLPEIFEEEISFEIPDNWCWVRLGEITFNHGQKKPDAEFTYIDISSINNLANSLGVLDNILKPNEAPSRARKIVREGDVIYATVRPYLHNICLIDRKIEPEPIVSTGFAVVTSTKAIINKYLFRCFLSPMFDRYANDNDNSKGVAYPAINDDKFSKALIPLPPLAEQYRIVERLEELLPLCATLE